MDRSKLNAPGEPDTQRDALSDAQERATETVPQDFRDEANADKTVEISPVEPGRSSSIQGIDPKR